MLDTEQNNSGLDSSFGATQWMIQSTNGCQTQSIKTSTHLTFIPMMILRSRCLANCTFPSLVLKDTNFSRITQSLCSLSTCLCSKNRQNESRTFALLSNQHLQSFHLNECYERFLYNTYSDGSPSILVPLQTFVMHLDFYVFFKSCHDFIIHLLHS